MGHFDMVATGFWPSKPPGILTNSAVGKPQNYLPRLDNKTEIGAMSVYWSVARNLKWHLFMNMFIKKGKSTFIWNYPGKWETNMKFEYLSPWGTIYHTILSCLPGSSVLPAHRSKETSLLLIVILRFLSKKPQEISVWDLSNICSVRNYIYILVRANS